MIEATDEGLAYARGWPCRRIAARTDLERASAAAPAGLKAPAAARFEDVHAMPLELWIDGERGRRVRAPSPAPAPGLAVAVELWDLGVDTHGVDWSALPTDRSPDIAAALRSSVRSRSP